MNTVNQFKSRQDVKQMLKAGNLKDAASLAISLGNVTKDNSLREYGNSLLKQLYSSKGIS